MDWKLMLLIVYVFVLSWSFPVSYFTQTKNAYEGSNNITNSTNFSQLIRDLGSNKTLSTNPTLPRATRMVPRPASEPQVNVLISEVNLDNPGYNKRQFVELQVTPKKKMGRPKGNMLEGIFLLVIESEPLQIVLSVHLGDRMHNIDPRKKYLVLGSPFVENVNVDVSAQKIHNIYANSLGVDIFPVGDRGPVGIAIIYQPDRTSYSDLLLFKSPHKIFLPRELANNEPKRSMIESLVIDFVAVGRRAPVSSCGWFDRLYPAGTNIFQRVILRDWEVGSETIEHSLNRCCDNDLPFQSNTFKVGKPTPGFDNNCEGLHFNLEQNIDSLTIQVFPQNSSEAGQNCVADFANIPGARYMSIGEENYKLLLQKHMRSPLNGCPSSSTETVSVALYNATTRVTELELTLPVFRNYTYNKDWRSSCAKYLPNQGAILGYKHISSWVDIEVSGTECRFSCYFCKSFFEQGFRIDYKHKTNVMKEKGYFSNSPSYNREALEEHSTSSIHVRAYQYGVKMRLATTAEERVKLYVKERSSDNDLYKPTMQVLQFVYTEVKSDVSFNKHSLFMSTLSKLGLDVGIHHNTDKGSKEMMQAISKGFHKKLLRFLTESSKPFSLIIDGTTYKSVQYLVALIQTLEQNRPVIFFYHLFPVDNERGETMAKSLQELICKDNLIQENFEEFFKSKLIVQVSDSASNMIGQHNSFYSHISAYVGRKIGLVRCASHRVELALKHAMQSIKHKVPVPGRNATVEAKYFEIFAKTNNALFTFYFSRGSKRFQHLADIAEELGIHVVRLKYYFDIRWASSHRSAMTALKQDYDALVADLLAISKDNSFDSNARSKAINLYTQLIDKTFAVTVNEFIDILNIFETMSLSFQQQTGLLTAKVEVIIEAIDKINAQKLKPGENLQTFLDECKCENVCAENQCSLEQYDSCDHVERGRQELRKTDSNAIKLSEHRVQLYDTIISELRRYFQMETLQSFNLFNPKYFKFQCGANCSDLSSCYNSFIDHESRTIRQPLDLMQNVCEFYHITASTCLNIKAEWPGLVKSLVSNSVLIEHRLNDVSIFWHLAMSLETVHWTKSTRQMVEYVLVTSFSSAHAERSFSIIGSLQYKERQSLTPENLESLSRIKINGPDEIDQIDAMYYTKQFLTNHARVDDKTQKGGRPKQKFVSSFEDSEVF